MSPGMQMIMDILDNAVADFVFGLIVLLIFAVTLVALLFAGLTVRAIWRWLTRRSWNHVIVFTERKALRRI